MIYLCMHERLNPRTHKLRLCGIHDPTVKVPKQRIRWIKLSDTQTATFHTEFTCTYITLVNECIIGRVTFEASSDDIMSHNPGKQTSFRNRSLQTRQPFSVPPHCFGYGNTLAQLLTCSTYACKTSHNFPGLHKLNLTFCDCRFNDF